MNAQLQKQPMTIEEYLDFEQSSDTKHEFHHGEIVAMTGGTINHNVISVNITTDLKVKLKGSSCRPFAADVKLKVDQDFFYPDVMVICDKDAESKIYKTAPVLIVEVLSKSTSKLDHTYKRLRYQTISSLEEYVLIEQDEAKVAVFTRKASWQPSYYYLGDTINFDLLGITVLVEDIYEQVDNEDVIEFLQKKSETAG